MPKKQAEIKSINVIIDAFGLRAALKHLVPESS
jgi:hypothetical protein